MQHLELVQKKTIMYTVMAVLFFSAVNQTIIGTALPKIVSSLGGMEYFNWVFTIFMLTSSISSLLAGKLSDNYGRKPFFIFGIIVLIIGSLLCGSSSTMVQLIVFRAIQGVGAGIIISLSFTSVADLFNPRERGKWQGLLTSIFGLSSLVGPTLGGYIVDHIKWNWVFWVFMPLGIIALYVMIKYYPKKENIENHPQVDYFGIISFSFFISFLLYYLSILGQESFSLLREIYLLLSIIFFILFFYIELKAKDPVIPLYLFKRNTYFISNIVSFFLGMGMFSIVIYIPFYMQGVMQVSATISGIAMMCMTISLVIASSIGGNLITYTGKYKLIGIIGISIMISGMYYVSLLDINTGIVSTFTRLVVFGIGLGISFTVFTLSVQYEVNNNQMGVAVSSVQLFRQLGGTIGVSLFSGIFSAILGLKIQNLSQSLIVSNTPKEGKIVLNNPKILLDHNSLNTLTNELTGEDLINIEKIILALRTEMGLVLNTVFLISVGILFCSLLFAIFLKEIELDKKKE